MPNDTTIPLPEPSRFIPLPLPGQPLQVFTADQMHTHAAAQSAADNAGLRERVQILREALDWCVAEINRDSPAVINARAALGEP